MEYVKCCINCVLMLYSYAQELKEHTHIWYTYPNANASSISLSFLLLLFMYDTLFYFILFPFILVECYECVCVFSFYSDFISFYSIELTADTAIMMWIMCMHLNGKTVCERVRAYWDFTYLLSWFCCFNQMCLMMKELQNKIKKMNYV